MHTGCDVVISFSFAPLIVTPALSRLIARPYGAACNSAVQVIFARWQSGSQSGQSAATVASVSADSLDSLYSPLPSGALNYV